MKIGLLYVDDFQHLRSQRIGSLGLGYISAYLKNALGDIEIQMAIDAHSLQAFQPDLIGVSAYTETLPLAEDFAQELKSLNCPLVLGGPHIASHPQGLPSVFDAGVVGEGEAVFLALAQLVQQNGFTPQNLSKIQGLSYWEDKLLKQTGRAPAIQDMDSLAHPDRQQMFAPLYRASSDFYPVIHIHTARGCPYRCTFCSAPLVNPQWRFHSPDWVIAELEQIARQFPDCNEITISDDLFTLKKSRLESLVKAIREAGFHRRFYFYCSSRSNTLTPDMCRLLLDMNVLMVSFGLESASDQIIRDLKGVGTHQADYERVLDLCHHHGIYAHGNFILGSQDETRSDLANTYRFVQTHKDRMASVYFSHMTPFPGTVVWEQADSAGLIPEPLDYRVLNLEFEPEQSVFLNTQYSEAFYAQAFRQFKRMSNQLNDRYYQEQALLKDMVHQQRHLIPAEIQKAVHHLGWKKIGIYALQNPHLNLNSASLIALASESQVPDDLDGVILYYYLETLRDPEPFVAALPQKPLLMVSYHMGHFYELLLLLLGKWESSIYGIRQPHHLNYYTLSTLKPLLSNHALESYFKFTLQESPPTQLLQLLEPIAKCEEVDTFSYLSLWLPVVSA